MVGSPGWSSPHEQLGRTRTRAWGSPNPGEGPPARGLGPERKMLPPRYPLARCDRRGAATTGAP